MYTKQEAKNKNKPSNFYNTRNFVKKLVLLILYIDSLLLVNATIGKVFTPYRT